MGWTDDTGYDHIADDLIARSADILRTHRYPKPDERPCPNGPHWGCHNLAHREQATQHIADPAREH